MNFRLFVISGLSVLKISLSLVSLAFLTTNCGGAATQAESTVNSNSQTIVTVSGVLIDLSEDLMVQARNLNDSELYAAADALNDNFRTIYVYSSRGDLNTARSFYYSAKDRFGSVTQLVERSQDAALINIQREISIKLDYLGTLF